MRRWKESAGGGRTGSSGDVGGGHLQRGRKETSRGEEQRVDQKKGKYRKVNKGSGTGRCNANFENRETGRR